MFDIEHDLSISAMSHLSHLLHAIASCLEDTSRLRMQHERYRQQSLDPFYPWSAVKKIDISAESKNKNSGVNFLIVILNKIKYSITYKLISPMSFKGVYSRQRCSERK
jgi:hypothetical protein